MSDIIKITENEVYKKVIEDSMGGIMYNKHPSEYDSQEILNIWDNLEPYEKERADGILKGAIDFFKDNRN